MLNQALTIGNTQVRQTESGLYCLNDLHKASGGEQKHTPGRFTKSEWAESLVGELSQNWDIEVLTSKPKLGTYACKELVYAYAMWISPSFSVKVIRAFDAIASGDEQTALKVADTEASRKRLDYLVERMEKSAPLTYLGAHTKTAVAAVLASEELTPKQREDGEYHRKALQRRGIHLASVIKQVVRDQGNRTDMGELVDAVQRHQEICFDFSPEYLRDFTSNMIAYGALTESMGIIKTH